MRWYCDRCGGEVIECGGCIQAPTPPQSKGDEERARSWAIDNYHHAEPEALGAGFRGALWGLSTARAEREAEVADWKRKAELLLNQNAEILFANHAMKKALEKIAGQDYRGNRSAEMQIAWEALKESGNG